MKLLILFLSEESEVVKSVYLTVPLMLGSISAAYGATIEIVSGIVGDEGMARGDTPIEIYPSLDTCNSI